MCPRGARHERTWWARCAGRKRGSGVLFVGAGEKDSRPPFPFRLAARADAARELRFEIDEGDAKSLERLLERQSAVQILQQIRKPRADALEERGRRKQALRVRDGLL